MDPATMEALNTIVPGISPWMVIAGTAVGFVVPAVSFVCSILSAVLPDGSPGMKIANVVAVNVRKAKNDPSAQ